MDGGHPPASRFARRVPLALCEGGRGWRGGGDGGVAKGRGPLYPSDISPMNGGNLDVRPPRASPARLRHRAPLRLRRRGRVFAWDNGGDEFVA